MQLNASNWPTRDDIHEPEVTIYMAIMAPKRAFRELFSPRWLIGIVRCEDRRMLAFEGNSHL